MRGNNKNYGARMYSINLKQYFNWPEGKVKGEFLKNLKEKIISIPKDKQNFWGIPFKLGKDKSTDSIFVNKFIDVPPILLDRKADYLCFLHQWEQADKDLNTGNPHEGLVVGEYILEYNDKNIHTQMIRARFEVGIAFSESPGPAWLAVPYKLYNAFDPIIPPDNKYWGLMQFGVRESQGDYLVYAMKNPFPSKRISSLKIKGIKRSPIIILGLTLYQGSSHPLRHLPRRTYFINADKHTTYQIESAKVNLGLVTRIEKTPGKRNLEWLKNPGVNENSKKGEEVLHLVGAEDATVSVKLKSGGKIQKYKFSLGEAYHTGKSISGGISLNILDKRKQWMQVSIIDSSTGKHTPARIHFSGKEGRYIAPYGHHEQVNSNWFEDYGADVNIGGRNFAYVSGTFTTDLPVGDVYIEISKGFEYKVTRQKVTIKPGQKELKLTVDRWIDLRSKGWVTADTHVHFISPHTAWLEGQAEGVNVVNLLASQWGRLFTNVGDFTGRVGIVEDDTIVYVGTENRNHMLGHISMLGTKGLPVYPMCCGQPTEAYVGDSEFMMLTDWALRNKNKGGIVIRPHYPYNGHTEDPVTIIKGLVDALEINDPIGDGFPFQEWYRYLNCGYRVAVCGGTDKMGAYTDLGWLRTYVLLDKTKPFNYKSWMAAVRAGKTISTTGPLIDFYVDGNHIGETIQMGSSGGTVEVHAMASSFWPINELEVIYNGKIISSVRSSIGENILNIKEKVKVDRSGWFAARCKGGPALKYGHIPWEDQKRIRNAHTSPVYIKCGQTRAFDGPAAEHMLALVDGGIEYLNTIATMFDESTRKRMVKQYKEVQEELKIRILKEAGYKHHPGESYYHTHGHGMNADHKH